MAGDPSTMTQDQLEAYYAQVAQMQYVSGARYGEVDPELYQMRQDELFSSYYSDGTEEDLPVRPYTSTVPRNRSPHPPAQRQAVQEKQDAEAPEKAAFSGKSNSLTPPVAVSSPDFAPAENRNQAKGPQEAIDHELLLEDQPDPGDTPETTQQQNGASSPEESVPEFIVQQEVESDGDPTLSWVPEDEDNPTLTWDIEDFDQGYDEDEYEEPDYGYPGDRYIPAEDPTVDFPESELASPDVGEANRAAGKREPYLSQRMGQAASRSVSVPSNEMREQVLEEDQEREEQ